MSPDIWYYAAAIAWSAIVLGWLIFVVVARDPLRDQPTPVAL
jgi:hypothetical protein